MLEALNKITDSENLNRELQGMIFPELPFDNTLNLAKHWTLQTENGADYVKKHGLDIVCDALSVFRNKRLAKCIFAHRDMRSDVLGIPMVPGWQIALFDQCMSTKTCNSDVIKTSVYNDVLTRECYPFVFPQHFEGDMKRKTTEKNKVTPKSAASSPVPKKRKKT